MIKTFLHYAILEMKMDLANELIHNFLVNTKLYIELKSRGNEHN